MPAPAAGKLRRLTLTLIKMMSCYVVVALAYMAIEATISSPFVKMQSKQLAWHLSPNHTFPFPLEPGDLNSNHFLDRDARSLLSDFAVMMAVAGAIHLITFSVTVILHRRRSVPNYWRDLDPPPDATRMLLRSAQLGSWAFLLTAISRLVEQFEMDCRLYGSSIALTGNMSLVAAFAASILVLMSVSSRTVKQGVLECLSASDRRCVVCEQALHITTANRCPECGRPFDPASQLDYRLKWGPLSYLITRRWPVVTIACLVMLVIPFGLAQLVRHMPQSTQKQLSRHGIWPEWHVDISFFTTSTYRHSCK